MNRIVALTVAGIAATVAGSAAATSVVAITPQSLPTLSEIGLGAAIVILAGVAGWAIRRRK